MSIDRRRILRRLLTDTDFLIALWLTALLAAAVFLEVYLDLGWITSRSNPVEEIVSTADDWIGWILGVCFTISLGLIGIYRQILPDSLEGPLHGTTSAWELLEYRGVMWFPFFLSLLGVIIFLSLLVIQTVSITLSYILSQLLILICLWCLTALWQAGSQTFQAGFTAARYKRELEKIESQREP